jgi:phosphatidylinositol glycan class A protein
MRSLRIAFVSDFFCPNTGGIETHLYYLGKCLTERGHSVVVLTHAYGKRVGIRFLSNGIKVYYMPFALICHAVTLPSVFASAYWYRKIFLKERIQVVHGHSSFSGMAHEALFHAWCMGLRTVFTDHSLAGFADASAILMNKLLLKYSLTNLDRIICVSHTSKENTVLRAGLPPLKVSVIPNAIDTDLFLPDKRQFYENPTTVIVLCRLVYRKGADLLVEVIPEVCRRHSSVRFIIGGDGPKRVELEEMREKYKLHHRVAMMGTIPHDKVRDTLVQGQIFLNTSLTEAFCVSIVEAATCGLYVVSTRIGGIPEVLPGEYIGLAEPISTDIADVLLCAIKRRESDELLDPEERHNAVKEMYHWQDVALRTENVYQSVINEPQRAVFTKITNYSTRGVGFGIVWMFVALLNLVLLSFFNICERLKSSVKPTKRNGISS